MNPAPRQVLESSHTHTHTPPNCWGPLTSTDTPATLDSGEKTHKLLWRVCPSTGRAKPLGRAGGRSAPGQIMVWKGKAKTNGVVRCCFVL